MRSNTMGRAVCAAGVVVVLWSRAASAQVSFVAPDHPPDWDRYKTPHECLAAADRERDTGWRAARRDTVAFEPAEVVPAAAIAAAKHCVARFSMASADRSDLKALFLLGLLVGNDAMTDSATARWVATSPTPRLRGAALENMVDFLLNNLNARPVRIERIRQLMRQADALGPAALREQIHIHSMLAQYGESVLDLDLLLAQSKICDSLFRATPTDPWTAEEREMIVYALYIIRGRMAEVTFLRQSPDSAFAQLRAIGIPLEVLSKPVPPISGVFSFKNTVPAPPMAGHVSLVVFASQACGPQCAPNWATIRRLHHQFPDVPITVVAQTLGWYRTHSPPPLAEEAELIRGYFQDDMHLPAAVVVDTTPHWFLPAPDGRRINGTPPSFVAFHGAAEVLGTGALVVDATGRMVFQNLMMPETERLFSAVMEKVGAVAVKSSERSASHAGGAAARATTTATTAAAGNSGPGAP